MKYIQQLSVTVSFNLLAFSRLPCVLYAQNIGLNIKYFIYVHSVTSYASEISPLIISRTGMFSCTFSYVKTYGQKAHSIACGNDNKKFLIRITATGSIPAATKRCCCHPVGTTKNYSVRGYEQGVIDRSLEDHSPWRSTTSGLLVCIFAPVS